LKSTVQKYIVTTEDFGDKGEVGEFIDTFIHPNGRRMISLLFRDRGLKGYYVDEVKPLLSRIK
jgi:hypothetical protein